jgi:hypothetical protein
MGMMAWWGMMGCCYVGLGDLKYWGQVWACVYLTEG